MFTDAHSADGREAHGRVLPGTVGVLAPTFPRAMAREPRVNGGEGLPSEFDPLAWRLQVLGADERASAGLLGRARLRLVCRTLSSSAANADATSTGQHSIASELVQQVSQVGVFGACVPGARIINTVYFDAS